MEEKNLPRKIDPSDLRDVFSGDKNNSNLLAMNDFSEKCLLRLEQKITKETILVASSDISNLMQEITIAIKSGYDFLNSKMLVADFSHLSKDVIEGLKSGKYHIGESAETLGNYRPAILDENNHYVKMCTLKKGVDITNSCMDIYMITLQRTLKNISEQLETIELYLEKIYNQNWNENTSTKFMVARDCMFTAANKLESGDEYGCYQKLELADENLNHGLQYLYNNLDLEIEELVKSQPKWWESSRKKEKAINLSISNICKDMQSIPKFMILRAYLFALQGDSKNAERIFEEYREKLEILSTKKVFKNYTAFGLIHTNFKYNEINNNFWLSKPEEMISELGKAQNKIDTNIKDVFFLEEDDINEE